MDKKILVIEDDPVATRLIDYVLRQRGYQVLAAPNGLTGLQLAQKEQPDLVVLNVMLPGIDGFEVCHRLRSGPKQAQPIILMLSGRAQPEDIENGLSTGADAYLTKPASPTEIVSKVESLLAGKVEDGSRTVAFIGAGPGVGATVAAVYTAIALVQADKRVLLADCCPYEGSASARLGIRPRGGVTEPDGGGAPAAPVNHETGLSVLRLPPKAAEDAAPQIGRLGDSADYLILDMPLQPGNATREMLARCSLNLVVSDYTLDSLLNARLALNALRFLDVPGEKTAVVLSDPRGGCRGHGLDTFKSYVETSLGASVLGTMPFDSGISAAGADTLPSAIAGPESMLTAAAKDLAQWIVSAGITEPDGVR